VAELTFSNAAAADLEAIDEFSVATFGEDVADTYMRGFNECFARLQNFPLAAPATPALGDHVRCLVHRQHRIFYQVSGDSVYVVRVVHHAMDAKRALKGTAG
jgi:toxin ParE1/3/4